MATSSRNALNVMKRLLADEDAATIAKRLEPVDPADHPLPPEVPEPRHWSPEATAERRAFIAERSSGGMPHLNGASRFEDDSELRGNIEQYIGMTQIPTGIIGPLRINGTVAKGDFYVPLATSEGALVASYHRGAIAASRSGGVTSVCIMEAVQRAPIFVFESFRHAGLFVFWVMEQIPRLAEVVEGRSRFARLQEVRPNIDGNTVTLICEYTTGDAAGQNMVTLATDAVCRHIIAESPMKPVRWYVEGNLSGDKKATSLSLTSVRGKKVTAEAVIRRDIVHSVLHTTAEEMLAYWKQSMISGVESGSIGVNAHFANGLAGLFLACGQDVACITEASIGMTRLDATDAGDLYVSVTLPSLIVGTVGGGTALPTQRECLELLGCFGTGGARKFAEICAATVLAGEISIVAAITAGDFARAHALYGRRKRDR